MSKFVDLYYACLLCDVEVFSQPWLYWWFLVPAAFYFVFFVLKWAVLTMPFWLPVVIVRTAK